MKQYSESGVWLSMLVGIALSIFSLTSSLFFLSIVGTGLISIGMWMLATNQKHEEMVKIIMSLNQSTEDERKLFLKNLQKKPRGSILSKIVIWFLLLIILALILVIVTFVFQIKLTVRNDIIKILNQLN